MFAIIVRLETDTHHAAKQVLKQFWRKAASNGKGEFSIGSAIFAGLMVGPTDNTMMLLMWQ